MGGGFCIKAVTRYAVLYDVCFSFCLALARPLFCNEQILFLSWRRGRGAGGECPEAKTPYSIFIHDSSENSDQSYQL